MSEQLSVQSPFTVRKWDEVLDTLQGRKSVIYVDGRYYAVNYLPNSDTFELRYELDGEDDFERFGIEPSPYSEFSKNKLRDRLVEDYGEENVWENNDAWEIFDNSNITFAYEYVGNVIRKSDGAKGSMFHTGSPRFYYNFRVDER